VATIAGSGNNLGAIGCLAMAKPAEYGVYAHIQGTGALNMTTYTTIGVVVRKGFFANERARGQRKRYQSEQDHRPVDKRFF
jgi:hypothetical protein